MATTKNITMKQFNGTDYDTLYPKTDVKQIENLTPSSIGAVSKSGDTMTGSLTVPTSLYVTRTIGNNNYKMDYAARTTIPLNGKNSAALTASINDAHEVMFLINSTGAGFVDRSVNVNNNSAIPFLHTGNAQSLGFTKIATGSYVGTGTAGQGQSTATVLTFNFAPKFLILVGNDGAAPGGTTLLSKVGAYSIYGYSGFYHFYTYSSGFACKLLGWGTNTLSYYTNGADATYQFNASGKTYYYMALG